MLVRELGEKLCLWTQIEEAVRLHCDSGRANWLLEQLGSIPVLSSWATRRLGCYVFRGAEPVSIRLQFAQEPVILRQTFLHEIAHACDHLHHEGAHRRRGGHGNNWRQWVLALGGDAGTSGTSVAVAALHHRRQKLVAVCLDCGAELHRVRRLNRNRRYFHPTCGGVFKKL